MNTKILFVSALLLMGACSSRHKHPETKAELTQAMKTQEAETLVQNMLTAAQNRDWKEFEKYFASRVLVHREEPLLLKPDELSHRMRPTQKYFDAMQASLSDFKLEEKHDRVLGYGNVTNHFWKNRGIKSDVVTTEGKAEFEFIRENGQLKIMRMQTLDSKTKGEKDLLRNAMMKSREDIRYKVEVVDFPSKNGKKIRGWLYRPYAPVHDVVIINGNLGGIKEQGPMQYAKLLASKEIATLVFDYINFGESEGDVRNLEDPGQKIDDFRGAVDYVANLDTYAGARISLAGLGSSAGYIAAEAATDGRVDRVLMIAPFFHSRFVEKQQFQAGRKLTMARDASHQFTQDGVRTYIPVVSFSDNNAVITSESASDLDYYINPERGNIPQWQNRFATIGLSPWINFDVTNYASRIRVPTLVIHSKVGPFAEGVDDFISQMRTKPIVHELSTSPYDFYDRPETMNQVVEIVERFLNPASSDTEVTSL